MAVMDRAVGELWGLDGWGREGRWEKRLVSFGSDSAEDGSVELDPP